MKPLNSKVLVYIANKAQWNKFAYILGSYDFKFKDQKPLTRVISDSLVDGIYAQINLDKTVQLFVGPYDNAYSSVDNFLFAYEVDADRLMKFYMSHMTEGKEYYSLIYGKVIYEKYDSPYYKFIKDKSDIALYLYFTGRANPDGQIMIYPSQDLYLEYHDRVLKAWAVWYEKENSPLWRAKSGDVYWTILDCAPVRVVDSRSKVDNLRYSVGNYFGSEAECVKVTEKFMKMLDDERKFKINE